MGPVRTALTAMLVAAVLTVMVLSAWYAYEAPERSNLDAIRAKVGEQEALVGRLEAVNERLRYIRSELAGERDDPILRAWTTRRLMGRYPPGTIIFEFHGVGARTGGREPLP